MMDRDLIRARTVDPRADTPDGLTAREGCLLVGREFTEDVIALFPGAYEDPNPEGLDFTRDFTRVVLPEEAG